MNITRGDFALMTSWNANVVRIALNQDFWLPGGAPPSISLDSSDGNPAPGALRVTAPLTAFDQLVDAIVNVSQPGLNLSGQQLHVMVKLVSGAFGGMQFHASSGANFNFTSAPFVGSFWKSTR